MPSTSKDPGPGYVVEAPKSADSFVDSVGVDTHFNYTGENYVTNSTTIINELIASGIRHVRDSGTSEGDRLTTLAAHGIGHSFGASMNDTAATITKKLSSDPNVEFAEPNNEYDGAMKRDPDWAAHLRAEQILLYKTIKANPAFSKIVVLGPSLRALPDAALVGDLSSYMDAGSEHDGTCYYNPGTINGDNDIFKKLQMLKPMDGNKPAWTTEIGNTDNLLDYCGVADDVLAKYYPRTIGLRWIYGQPRSYFYQFSDEETEGKFGYGGLIAQSATPKPQYYSMQSMLSLLADPGPAFTPASFSYLITGNTSNVDHILLEKRDGSYWLLLWVEKEGWNILKQRVAIPPQPVTISSPSLSSKKVQAYTYSASWRLNPTTLPVVGNAVKLNATDQITFVRIGN